MGEQIEFNWILKLKSDEVIGLRKGEIRGFRKEGERRYPTKTLIDLVDENFVSEGVIKIKNYSYDTEKNETKGEYEIIHLYNPKEKEFLTQNYRMKYLPSDF